MGFIRKLPHHLVASFKSTLEEAADTDLLLHVIDIAHANFQEQMHTVEGVLKELELDKKPVLNVFNKIDLHPDASIFSELRDRYEPCVFVSAQRGIFLNELKKKIARIAEQSVTPLKITLPADRYGLISRLHDLAEITSIRYADSQAVIEMKATPVNAQRIRGICDAYSGH